MFTYKYFDRKQVKVLSEQELCSIGLAILIVMYNTKQIFDNGFLLSSVLEACSIIHLFLSNCLVLILNDFHFIYILQILKKLNKVESKK